MKLSGVRLDQFNELKRIYRNERRRVHRDEVELDRLYNAEVARLEKLETAVEKRRQGVRRRLEAKRLEQERLRKIESSKKLEARRQRASEKRKEKQLQKATLGSISFTIPTSVISKSVYDFVTKHFLKDKEFRVIINGYTTNIGDEKSIDMKLISSIDTEIEKKVIPYNHDTSYDNISSKNKMSERWTTDHYYAEIFATSIVFYKATKLKSVRKPQSFRDGIQHCVLDIMEQNLTNRANTYTSTYDKNKIKKLLGYVAEYKIKYDLGIPETEMEEVCKTLKFNVSIYDLLDNELYVFNKNSKLHRIEYCNVRLNHLEVGRLCLMSKPEEVSQEQLNAILEKCIRDKRFYVYEGNPKKGKIYGIRTIDGAWRIANPDIDEMNECNKKNNLNNYGLNATLQPELNNYIRESNIIHSTNTIVNGGTPIDHLDMKNAYTQWKQFSGAKFLGKIHQYGKLTGYTIDFVNDHIGIYRFRCLSVSMNEMGRLGFQVGSVYTLPSVEIQFLVNKGYITIELLSGVWGSSIEMNLDNNMIDKRKLYQEWSGRLGMQYDSKVFIFPGTKEEAEQLSAILGSDVVKHYEYTGFIHIYRTKKSVKTLHHIFAFITSYTRMNILLKMEEVGFENVVSVVLDGIYLKKEFPEDTLFRKKPIVEHNDHKEWYSPSIVSDDFMIELDTFDVNYSIFKNTLIKKGVVGNVFLQGQGGSGKSHYVFNNRCYNKDILYIVPTRDLGIKKQKECGIQWTTIQKFVGEDYIHADGKIRKCRSWKDEAGRSPAVGFIDEVTMMNKSLVEKAISMHPDTLFILAGDIEGKQWFQCRNGDGKTFAELYDVSNWNTIKFEKDWRAIGCSKLIKFKQDLRDVMRTWIGEGGRIDASFIEAWIRMNVNLVSYSDAIKMFVSGDLWIDPLRATSEKLLNNGICSGYRCKYEGKDKDGIYRTKGEILPYDAGTITEKKGSITTHSIQGHTISSGKIFISVANSFEYAMIYTAVSRAVSFDQLVFVC